MRYKRDDKSKIPGLQPARCLRPRDHSENHSASMSRYGILASIECGTLEGSVHGTLAAALAIRLRLQNRPC